MHWYFLSHKYKTILTVNGFSGIDPACRFLWTETFKFNSSLNPIALSSIQTFFIGHLVIVQPLVVSEEAGRLVISPTGNIQNI